MDLSFIEPAFSTSFGNVSVTKTEKEIIFKSTLAEDSYFSLELSLDLSKLERVYETKNEVHRFRTFFDKNLIKIGDEYDSICSILVRFVQNLSTVSEWAGSSDDTNLPTDRMKFVGEEFGRLESLYQRKNYLIIGGNKTIYHYPEGCGLVLQIKNAEDGIVSTRVTTKDYGKTFQGNTLRLVKIIGWWFHNQGESLEDWLSAPPEVFGVFGLETLTVAQPVSKDIHRSRFLMISHSFVGTVHESYFKMVLSEIIFAHDHGKRSTIVAKPVQNESVITVLTCYGYQIKPVRSIYQISW